jgi:tetratricopeptide (TPR) repeat protein
MRDNRVTRAAIIAFAKKILTATWTASRKSCRFALYRVYIFLKFITAWFFKNPAKNITELGGAGAVITIMFYFLYYIFSQSIFIDDVQLQEGTKDLGRQGDKITQAALAAVPGQIQQRIGALPFSPALGAIVERDSDFYQTEMDCNLNLPLGATNYEIYKIGIERAKMSSKTVDKIISDESFSLKKFAYDVRKWLSRDQAREITPILYKKDKMFVISLSSSPLELENHKKEFKDIDDAHIVLADLLIDYLSPEVLATEFLLTGHTKRSNFEFTYNVAERFLKDRQKALFIGNIFAASQLELSRSHASAREDYRNWERFNAELLESTNFSRYRALAPLVKAGVTQRLMLGELARLQDEGKGNADLRSLYKKYFSPLQKDLEATWDGTTALALIEMQIGERASFSKRVEVLIADSSVPLHWRYESIGFFGLATALEGDFEDAEHILHRLNVNDGEADGMSSDIIALVNAAWAIINVSKSDISTYRKVVKNEVTIAPCFEFFVTSKINEFIRKSIVPASANKVLIPLMAESIQKLGNSEIKSFDFFNEGGTILSSAGNYAAAYRNYEEALKYEGDHTWAWLNWGSAALHANDLSVAREKYEKSLSLGTVPAAAFGLVVTLAHQGEHEAYLAALKKYASVILPIYSHAQRSDLERYAMAITCGESGKYSPLVIRETEGIILDGKPFDIQIGRRRICNN